MTEPRWKEWLFDVDRFNEIYDGNTPTSMALFIQESIQRNLKEFAEQVRHGVVIDQVRMNDKCRECQFEIWNEWDKKIDIALKERGVE